MIIHILDIPKNGWSRVKTTISVWRFAYCKSLNHPFSLVNIQRMNHPAIGIFLCVNLHMGITHYRSKVKKHILEKLFPTSHVCWFTSTINPSEIGDMFSNKSQFSSLAHQFVFSAFGNYWLIVKKQEEYIIYDRTIHGWIPLGFISRIPKIFSSKLQADDPIIQSSSNVWMDFNHDFP